MAGIEVVSLGIQVLSIVGYNVLQNWEDHGFWRVTTLHTVFVQANGVIKRVRKHVLGDSVSGATPEEELAREAWKLKESYAASFNMIAVAGAIVAQIAITALSLPYLEETHWTAQAAFVVSLIAGLLSVYYACMIQQQLSGLHSPEEVRRWLSTAQRDRHRHHEQESGAPKGSLVDIIPSYHAALLLILPAQLLNWSSISLLVGIGIYYGLVHAKNLGTLLGNNSNLAILIVYVLFTSGALLSYILPWSLKETEMAPTAQRKLIEGFNYRHWISGQFAGIDQQQTSENGAATAHQGSPNGTLRTHNISTPMLSAWSDPRAPRIQVDDWASTQPQALTAVTVQPQDDLDPATTQSTTWNRSVLNERINARPSAHPTPQHNRYDFDTQAIIDALQVSIFSQQASLRAQEMLLLKIRGDERSSFSRRRASFS